VLFPKVHRQGCHAAVKDVCVLQVLVAVVILGMYAEDSGLDPQVDVFGNQDDSRILLLVLQRECLREYDVIVGLAAGSPKRRRATCGQVAAFVTTFREPTYLRCICTSFWSRSRIVSSNTLTLDARLPEACPPSQR